ncbi:NSS family neurotransmitter:Na+ symporter [Methanocalculus alkaliphilus]|uniref:sodium-dependent transporter n=1 Tax=Methanocalculus alkaliphilus TaxID=768730 RepID=UPI0020A0D68D|nr:sodium-dependent transporter [Methanocalculus alkaliphilus]MCP1714344.1 NSS family neurotransmitter:Na+ symporter [Methanocalculus alkaliphilus]
MVPETEKEHWSSGLGFILASIGAAVGIGNIWRFSTHVGENGGGAFLLPFLLAVFVIALPLMILEIKAGRALAADVVTAFEKVHHHFDKVGWLFIAVGFVILSYYLVITGWTLAFVFFSLLSTDGCFETFTGSYAPVAFFIISALLTGGVVALGVKEGIERIARWFIPLSFFILIGLAIYVITLSGYREGIEFFLTPDFSVLSDPMLWGSAFGQAFFSLSVGTGILLTYGSYLRRTVPIARSAVYITLADLTVAILAGLIIFPIVFTHGLSPAMGAELTFVILPQAFEMIPYGAYVGFAFFLLLFVSALTATVSMIEMPIASLIARRGISRRRASLLLTGGVLLIGLPSALSYSAMNLSVQGIPILDLLDETAGTFGLPLTALATAIAFAWLLDPHLLREKGGMKGPIPHFILWVCRYVIPVVLVVTLFILTMDLLTG